MSEEFILEEYKSFRRHVVRIIEKKNGGHIKEIHFFASIFLFSYSFKKIKINLVL